MTIHRKAIGSAALLLAATLSAEGQTPADTTSTIKEQQLGSVSVVARRKKNTEAAAITAERRAMVVQNAVSAQLISRTQDKDASEVIRRIPGISLVDGKFVMVRGLSQRYNNVWINGAAVPSSEPDSRAFSFDIIPSSQIDNLTIVKSPAAEYPADYTGGFIMINTKDLPDRNGWQVSVGTGVNDRSQFRPFSYTPGSCTDFLGFDRSMRPLSGGFDAVLPTYPGTDNIDPLQTGLSTDWRIRRHNPLPDIKLGGVYSFQKRLDDKRFGLLATLNYNNSYRTALNMENSLFGAYDDTNDKPVYLRKSTDNQYTQESRLGGLLNMTLAMNNGTKLEWKNLVNQLGKTRYTSREGFNAQNDQQITEEYYFSSRTTYNTQLSGKHLIADVNQVDWNVGYSYANRMLPDRRLIEFNDRTDQTMGLYSADREFTRLDEHIASAAANWKRRYDWWHTNPTLKAGAYAEYRTRDYRTRDFYYTWDPYLSTLPEGFEFTDQITDLMQPDNFGADKLYMKEDVNFTNNYKAHGTQAAGYVAMSVPVGELDIYGGLRYEYSRTELITNTRQTEPSPISTYYTYHDLFPSVNLNYHLDAKQQVRLSAGRTVNRPEFRELSPVVFYDFDLASNVQGNADLKPAYIANLDLRYEWYPSAGEMLSVAVFYKHFKNPIEWTYTVAGGTNLIYSNKNAKAAHNAGIELDLRKSLGFMGLPDFSLSLNASYIYSHVMFEKGSKERNRAMQGQSPYLINAGIFYQGRRNGWSAAVLYNRIGKRIVGVGRSLGTTGSVDTKNIPDSYEMPRDAIDLTASKKIGHWQISAAIRDVLAQDVKFQQIETVSNANGSREIDEVTKRYKPGRTYSLTATYNF